MAKVICPFGTTWFNAPGDNKPKHLQGLCPCDGESEIDQEQIDEIRNSVEELINKKDNISNG